MSSTQTVEIELETHQTSTGLVAPDIPELPQDNPDDPPASAVEVVPDGGYGWVIVLCCSILTFLFNGWSGSFGVLQTALLQTYLKNSTPSTLSFVGSLYSALGVALGLGVNRLSQVIGARTSLFIGIILLSGGMILSSFTLSNIGGLFGAAGICMGIGTSLLYTVSNVLPIQWFSSRLGTANGLIKVGGGIGATVMAIALQASFDRVGIAWSLRILGFASLATGLAAVTFIKERAPRTRAPFMDLRLFKSIPFCCLFGAGVVGTFALFVPPFFLPLFAHSIGLSASTGAALVAAFNACTAVGRLGAGYACDKFGSVNTILVALIVNAVSMLAIWPVSETLSPLAAFAALNGLANGAFFVGMPTAVASIVGPVGMTMSTTGMFDS